MSGTVSLNGLDFIILGIFGLSILISFFRGFVRELVSLTSWVLAVILGIRYSKDLGATLFGTVIQSPTLQHALAFVIILIAVLVVGIIINIGLRNLIKRGGIGFTDAFLGVLFGLIRGLIVVTVLVLLLKTTAFENTESYKNSQLVPYVQLIINRAQIKVDDPIHQVTNWATTNEEKSR